MWPSLQHPSKDPQKTVAAAVQNLQHGGDTVVLQSNTLQKGPMAGHTRSSKETLDGARA